MTEAHLFAVGVLLAWLAGIRAYLTVFGVGIAGALGWLDLPPALQATTSPWVLGVSGALALTEFLADKIPGIDSAWDLVQTLARVPAGAFLAAAALSPDGDYKPVNLDHGLYKFGNRILFGLYMHANHHKRANIFNPAKMDEVLARRAAARAG